MGSTKRATLYLDADLHRAVRVKAAETERSVSELLNEALRQSLAEDAEDLEASRSREGAEPRLREGPEGSPASWEAIGCSSSGLLARSKASRRPTASAS